MLLQRTPAPVLRVLDQLENMNIRMVEEYGLPLSENIA